MRRIKITLSREGNTEPLVLVAGATREAFNYTLDSFHKWLEEIGMSQLATMEPTDPPVQFTIEVKALGQQ